MSGVIPAMASEPTPVDVPPVADELVASGAWQRMGDYLELTKPRIAVLVLFTVMAGGVIADGGRADVRLLVHAVIGTALVACGASILNQVNERHSDALMNRTARRPIPTGRVAPTEGAILGYGAAVVGTVYLVLLVNLLSAAVALASFILYVFIYTPMKRVTALNTVIGAIPGAFPPLVGWAAVRGSFSIDALWLFLLVFFWQFPHFFAIAWLYRDDYARAGLRMLPTTRLGRRMTGWQMVSFCLVLFPVTLAPVMTSSAGRILLVGSIILGLQFLGFCLAFLMQPSRIRAKYVLWSSLVYLPMMLILWMLDSMKGAS
ncbi:heme o synthase [bacterium]|jgi:heme o synthase|nr:heme o synthase [bacterium]